MNKLHVLLLYGGESTEHEVSIRSAHNVYAALDDSKYDVTLCYIDKVGRWWLTDDIDGAHIGHPRLFPDLGKKCFIARPDDKTVAPDVLFPVLHGRNGEDGTIQGLAALLHLPYVGPSLLSAAIAMDKEVTKQLLKTAGIPAVPGVVWRTAETRPSFEEVKKVLGLPMFVKPCNAGSSVGVSKVTTYSEWGPALRTAAEHDTKVLIEQGIDAREIELAVIGNSRPKVSGAGEIVAGEQFYTYEAKYADDSTSEVMVPAQGLDESTVKQLQDYALAAYRATSGHGMARVDFFIDKKTGEIYLNELNTIPGFTNISMYPKLWHAAGVSYAKLVDMLIDLALKDTV